MSELFRGMDFGGFMSWNTTCPEPCAWRCVTAQRVAPKHRTTHASSSTWPLHFYHHSFRTFCWAVHQPGDVGTFPQICNHSWSCRTSTLEGATFHRMNWCKFLRGNPCTAVEPFSHLGYFSSCCIKEFGDGFGCVIFARSGFPERSWSWSATDSRSCQSPFFKKATAFLSLFDLNHFVGCVSTWRCAKEHFSPKRQPFLFL